MKQIFFISVLFLLFISCRSLITNKSNETVSSTKFQKLDTFGIEDFIGTWSSEFDNEDEEEQYLLLEDTLQKVPEKDYFFKTRSITDSMGDSLYIWSFERGETEKIIDTLYYSVYYKTYFLWETDEFVAFISGCGTYCWTNTIIPIKTDQPIMNFSYSDIDFDNMNVVEVGENNFHITNLRTQKSIKIPIDGVECIDGYPLFYIDNVKLKNTIISYSISCGDGSKINKQIEIEENKLNLLK